MQWKLSELEQVQGEEIVFSIPKVKQLSFIYRDTIDYIGRQQIRDKLVSPVKQLQSW